MINNISNFLDSLGVKNFVQKDYLIFVRLEDVMILGKNDLANELKKMFPGISMKWNVTEETIGWLVIEIW